MTGALESRLAEVKASGRKALVPYLTGGLIDGWLDALGGVIDAGADAVEIGIPFSDPVMDGPTIQEANDIALGAGVTPQTIMDDLRAFESPVPLAAMTYYNIAHSFGLDRFAAALADCGVSAAILPDMPLEESGPWRTAAGAHGVETVMFAAPTSTDDRLALTAEAAEGFVYAVGLLGTTGERAQLAASATEIAARMTAVTAKPVLVGVGVSSPEQAVEVCQEADGVVIGSTVVRRLLEGGGAAAVTELVASFRAALDAAY